MLKERTLSIVIAIFVALAFTVPLADLLAPFVSRLEATGYETLAKVVSSLPLFACCCFIIILSAKRLRVWMKIAAMLTVVVAVSFISGTILFDRVDHVELDEEGFPSGEVVDSLNEKYENRLGWIESSGSNCRVYFPRQVFKKNELIEDMKSSGLGIK